MSGKNKSSIDRKCIYPDGCDKNSCPVCRKDLTYDNLNVIRDECNILTTQRSLPALTISFFTVISVDSYDYHHKPVTIRFKHKIGSYDQDPVTTTITETRVFDGGHYYKLEGRLQIETDQLYSILDNGYVKFHYKYFFNGVEEHLFHHHKRLERTIELKLIVYNNHFIEKYDQMPIPTNQVEPHTSITANIWRISLNIMLPDAPIREGLKTCRTIDDFLKQFREILSYLCYSNFYDGRKKMDLFTEKETLEKLEELVKDWLFIQLDSRISVDNYMYVFHLVFLIIGKYKLVSKCTSICKRMFEIINDKEILSIIEGRLWGKNRISEPEKLLETISGTVEAVLFVDTNRLIDTIRFLPLYHHVFDMFKEFELSHSRHDFPNERYWGLSQTNEIPKCFTKIDLPKIQNYLTTFIGIDNIYPYSILLLTCQKESLPHLLKMPEFPTDSFLSLLVYRIYKRNCSSCTNIDKCIHFLDSESRSKIYTFIINKLESEESNLSNSQVQIMCDSIFWIWENMEQQVKFSIKPTPQECECFLSLTALLLTTFNRRYKGELSLESLQDEIKTIRESKSIITIFLNIHETIYFRGKQSSNSSELFEQIKIWDYMLKCNFPKAYEWDITILSDLTTLLKRYDYRILVGLLNYLCQNAVQQIDVRVTQLTQSLLIDFLTSQNSSDSDSNYIAEKLEGVSTTHKKQIFSLYSTILLKQRRNFDCDPFNHILTWDLWKTYFSTDLLPENHQAKEKSLQFILEAENIFLYLVEQFCSNNVSIKALNVILENQHRVIILFQMQSTKHQEKHEIYRKINVEKHITSKSEILKHFKKRKEDIRCLHNFINPTLHVLEFSHFLSIDFDGMPCHCVFDDESILLPGHKISQAINSPECQTMLSTSEHLCKSEIFNHILQKLVTISEEPISPLFAANFYEQFWLPSFNIIEDLFENLISLSLPLSKVEEYFIDYKENENLALTELLNIASAVKLVSNKEITKCQITPAIDKVVDYFRLRNAFEIAAIIMDIQSSYRFKGDFSDVVSLIETDPQLKDQSLDSINDQVLKLAELLIEFSEQEKQILKTFSVHREFIDWVHMTFKDRSELKVFTDLVHTFCIDQPLQTGTNALLYGICLDLAPLIFDLDRQLVNSRIFLATCKEIFGKINAFDFLNNFKTATFNLWLQMKDTHASTLHGVREELKALMSGSIVLKLEPGREMNEIVSINFNEKDLNFTKELDSRITFLNDDEIVNCSLFRNIVKSIISLSTLVKTLHLAGHIHYRQYSLELPCTYSSLNHINNLIQEARVLLKVWTQQLDEARMRYYYLNYYTPNQIVSLQIELYMFQSSGKLDMKHINLLSIIKQDVILDEIISCMEKADCPTSINLCSGGNLFANVDLEYELCSIIETNPTIPKTEFPADFTQEEKDLCEDISKRAVVSVKTVIERVDYLKKDKKAINRQQISEYFILQSTDDDDTIEQELIIAKQPEFKPKIKGSFVSLRNLGTFLQCLKDCNYETLKVSHKFPQNFRIGTPNLVCVPSNIIIQTLLSLYLGPEGNHPLPYYNEILFCSCETTNEEVDMFWRRALFDPNTNHLYCIVYIDKLVYQVAAQSVSQLNVHLSTRSHKDAKLVLLCTDKSEYLSFMALSFQHCNREPPTNLIEIKQIQQLLFNKFSYKVNLQLSISQSSLTPAFNADPDQSYIRLVVSTTVGAGKSLAIQRLVSELESFQEDHWSPDHYNIISIHGDHVNESEVLERLKKIRNSDNGQVYHFDIASSVREELVPFLFKLFILGVISDFSGNIWCCNRKNYYVVELLLMKELMEINEFVSLFPMIFCHQPGDFVQSNTTFNKCDRTIDEQFMKSPSYQRAFAYLDRKFKDKPLDNFQHITITEPTYTHKEFLQTLLSNCGVENPSWCELNHNVF